MRQQILTTILAILLIASIGMSLALYFKGWLDGNITGIESMKKEAISLGYGYYNSTNGVWQWKDKD